MTIAIISWGPMTLLERFPAAKLIPRYLIIFMSGVLLFSAASTFAEEASVEDKYKDIHINPVGLTPSRECGKCHKDIYASWKNSLHAQAVSNPVFNTAYLQASFANREEAKRKCLPCHAPIAVLTDDFGLRRAISRESINCDYCHSITDVAANSAGPKPEFEFGHVKQGPLKNVKSPVHSTRYNKLYRQSLFCKGCHEYTGENGAKLIETFSEWQKSPYPAKGIHCQDCHMRKIAGKIVAEDIKKTLRKEISSHDIAGGHSLTMREKSIEVKITNIKRSRQKVAVTVEITNKGAGHKIPTGLPSKKIILQVSVQSKYGETMQTQMKFYQKLIVDKRGEKITDDAVILMGKTGNIASDNRIGPMETRQERFTFFVPKGKGQRISAAVFYSHNPKIIAVSPIRIKLKEVFQPLEP